MVDPSLLRQAADRGVTIAFADLDGADGLWVPEERTVLVNRGLSAAAVAEVIEHELTHVAIDDQHADLDAGRDVLVGRPPAARTGPVSMAVAAAGILAVVGGVAYGVSQVAAPERTEQVVGPTSGPGLTVDEHGDPVPTTTTTVVAVRDDQGRVVYRTVTMTVGPGQVPVRASSLAPTTSPAAPTRTGGSRAPAGSPPVVPTTATNPAPVTTSATPSPTPPATTEPTTPTEPPVTTPPAVEPGVGDDVGGIDEAGEAGTDAGTESLSATDPATAPVAPVITTGN